MQESSKQGLNALGGGSLGFLAGAVAAIVITPVTRGSDDFAGLTLLVFGPPWAIGTGVAGAIVAGLKRVQPHISWASWLGAIIGVGISVPLGILAVKGWVAVAGDFWWASLIMMPLIAVPSGVLAGMLSGLLLKRASKP